MQEFTYAHKNTESGERITPTAQFNLVKTDKRIEELRKSAFAREIPVSDSETLNFLTTFLQAFKPQNILELGTAVGISGAVMLDICKTAHLTTVERDENFYNEAVKNFKNLGLSERVTAIYGDAAEETSKLSGEYDFIFLDCAKVQYIKLLPRLKSLLKRGGVLLADDVLLFGYITGEAEVPKKRKMLVEHVREYLNVVTNDSSLSTTVLNLGNGLALSVKK
ncbi:MAG: O-methyltransferase [Clostridia bacterium]|nr:O-methyltransferase [Clostridia bacterium]